MIPVSQNVYVETSLFACNLGLITTREGILLIDTPMRPTDAIKWRNDVLKKGEVKYLVNTEEHPDHTACSSFFPGILITHEKTRETLKETPAENILEIVLHMNPEASDLLGGFSLRLADITFSDRLCLFLGGLEVHLLHLPGHSDGGIGVYVPEQKVVFTSDLVFCRKKSWLHEATPHHWLESLQRIKELDVEIVVPGHGELCNKHYLDEQRGIIEKWVSAVRSCIDKGMTEGEAFTKISPPDPYPKQPNTPMTPEELDRAIIGRLYGIYGEGGAR